MSSSDGSTGSSSTAVFIADALRFDAMMIASRRLLATAYISRTYKVLALE
jgi:hypothetical protein